MKPKITAFRSLRRPGFRGQFRSELQEPVLQREWQQLEESPFQNVLKKGTRTLVRAGTEQTDWILKLYWKQKARAKLRTALGQGRARRAFYWAQEIEKRNLACSKVLGYAEGRDFDVLISQKVLGTDLDMVRKQDSHFSEKISDALLHWIQTAHRSGLRARDLRLENFVFRIDPDRIVAILVDYDGIRSRRRDMQRLQDLLRLLRGLPRSWEKERTWLLRKYLLEFSMQQPALESLKVLRHLQKKDQKAAQESWIQTFSWSGEETR